MAAFIDLRGDRFGMLRAVQYVALNGGKTAWLCRCDCGRDHLVSTAKLRSGASRSCGCARGAHIAQAKYVHGSTRSALYTIWRQMISRCHSRSNRAFANYGGRGIEVCRRWRYGAGRKHGFECFKIDMGPRPSPAHTLDRKKNHRGYSPANCRWATRTEQARNRRTTAFVQYRGARIAVADLAERYGLSRSLLMQRLDGGMKIEEAILLPPRVTKRSAGHGDLRQPRETK